MNFYPHFPTCEVTNSSAFFWPDSTLAYFCAPLVQFSHFTILIAQAQRAKHRSTTRTELRAMLPVRIQKRFHSATELHGF